jgi:hypothetical protein
LEEKAEQKRILEHLEFTFKENVEEKVTEIKKEVKEKVTDIQRGVEEKVGEIKKDVERIKENFEGKVKEMEVKFKGLKTGLSGKLETGLVKLKPFDGTTSWSMYKKQFEPATGANNWDDEGKAVALTLTLRGQALQTLQTLSVEDQKNYAAFVKALELRYGDHHSAKCTTHSCEQEYRNAARIFKNSLQTSRGLFTWPTTTVPRSFTMKLEPASSSSEFAIVSYN